MTRFSTGRDHADLAPKTATRASAARALKGSDAVTWGAQDPVAAAPWATPASLVMLQRLAGNRAVTSMLAAPVQRGVAEASAQAPTKKAATTSSTSVDSYIDLLNGFEALAEAALDEGGRGLGSVRVGSHLSASHRSLLSAIRNVLAHANEKSGAGLETAATRWPGLAAKLEAAVTEARRLHVGSKGLDAAVAVIALVGDKFAHAPHRKAGAAPKTAEDYVGAANGILALLDVFSRLSESSSMQLEEVPGRPDAVVSQAVRSTNAQQRSLLAAVAFDAHLSKEHAELLEKLRRTLVIARTEKAGSAYSALTGWRSIRSELKNVLTHAVAFGDTAPVAKLMDETGTVLAQHYASVHEKNLGVALTKERRPEETKAEREVAKALPAAAAAIQERHMVEDFRYALSVIQQHLTPSPDHPGEWILTSGTTTMRVRADEVGSLRMTAAQQLKDYIANLTKAMVHVWQTYDEIKRGNSSFKLHVLGGWGGADDPGDPGHYKDSVIRVRDTIIFPQIDQGKYMEAFDSIISQKAVIERVAKEVGDYDADLDTGYSRLSRCTAVVQVALTALVPVAGEAALVSGAGVVAVGGTAVAAGAGGAALAETGRQVISGEGVDVGKIGKAAYSGGVVGAGAVAPAATKGLGNVLAAGEEGTAAVGAHALASGTVGAAQSKLSGGDALEGFAGGALGSMAGSAATKTVGAAAQHPLAQAGIGAGVAGVTGGDPLAGAAGGGVGALGAGTVHSGSAATRPGSAIELEQVVPKDLNVARPPAEAVEPSPPAKAGAIAPQAPAATSQPAQPGGEVARAEAPRILALGRYQRTFGDRVLGAQELLLVEAQRAAGGQMVPILMPDMASFEGDWRNLSEQAPAHLASATLVQEALDGEGSIRAIYFNTSDVELLQEGHTPAEFRSVIAALGAGTSKVDIYIEHEGGVSIIRAGAQHVEGAPLPAALAQHLPPALAQGPAAPPGGGTPPPPAAGGGGPQRPVPEAPSTELAQPGGLHATEGTRLGRPLGPDQYGPAALGPEAHPLTRHGPGPDLAATPEIAQVSLGPTAAELEARVAGGEVRRATQFLDRAQMETAVGRTIRGNEGPINTWLATNPPEGVNRAFDYDPRMGNLGRGFERAPEGGVRAIDTSVTPLDRVRVVLKSNGQGGYIIQTAHPLSAP